MGKYDISSITGQCESMRKRYAENCGTGAGGFQKGNECAAGEGSDTADDKTKKKVNSSSYVPEKGANTRSKNVPKWSKKNIGKRVKIVGFPVGISPASTGHTGIIVKFYGFSKDNPSAIIKLDDGREVGVEAKALELMK